MLFGLIDAAGASRLRGKCDAKTVIDAALAKNQS
jgi:hypothetical protein